MLDQTEAHRFLYRFIKRQIPIAEFEQWLYRHDELEELLGEKAYLDLVARDYRDKYAFEDTDKQIRNLIAIGRFEEERIADLLRRMDQEDNDALASLAQLYGEYCDGFDFLRFIALYYITTDEEYLAALHDDPSKRDRYLAPMKSETARLLAFFGKGELRITGEQDYEDTRHHADRMELHSVDEMFAAVQNRGGARR